jgi:hypothetical protein
VNKVIKIILATLGGIEAIFTIATPILVALIWIRLSDWKGWSSYILLIAGILTTFFRAIKKGWFWEK